MTNRGPAGRQEYYTIRGTNKIVRVGDTVILKSSKNERVFWPNVGRVEEFEFDRKGEIMNVRVRCYYPPEGTISGRQTFHGEKELFLSGHYDVQSADNIDGKCNIHSFKNYIKLEDVQAEDYYCRFKYHIYTGAFMPERIAVYCKCELPRNPDKVMVKCEGCKDWYHPACVGMTIEQAEQLDSYICFDCEAKDNIRKPSSTFANGKAQASTINMPWRIVAGKRKHVLSQKEIHRDDFRRSKIVDLDKEEDNTSDSPMVKKLKNEVEELNPKLGDVTSQLEALQAHVTMMSKHIGFPSASQAPSSGSNN